MRHSREGRFDQVARRPDRIDSIDALAAQRASLNRSHGNVSHNPVCSHDFVRKRTAGSVCGQRRVEGADCGRSDLPAFPAAISILIGITGLTGRNPKFKIARIIDGILTKTNVLRSAKSRFPCRNTRQRGREAVRAPGGSRPRRGLCAHASWALSSLAQSKQQWGSLHKMCGTTGIPI